MAVSVLGHRAYPVRLYNENTIQYRENLIILEVNQIVLLDVFAPRITDIIPRNNVAHITQNAHEYTITLQNTAVVRLSTPFDLAGALTSRDYELASKQRPEGYIPEEMQVQYSDGKNITCRRYTLSLASPWCIRLAAADSPAITIPYAALTDVRNCGTGELLFGDGVTIQFLSTCQSTVQAVYELASMCGGYYRLLQQDTFRGRLDRNPTVVGGGTPQGDSVLVSSEMEMTRRQLPQHDDRKLDLLISRREDTSTFVGSRSVHFARTMATTRRDQAGATIARYKMLAPECEEAVGKESERTPSRGRLNTKGNCVRRSACAGPSEDPHFRVDRRKLETLVLNYEKAANPVVIQQLKTYIAQGGQ